MAHWHMGEGFAVCRRGPIGSIGPDRLDADAQAEKAVNGRLSTLHVELSEQRSSEC